jgi:eukaryotic translation initiation factor 2C
LKLVELSPSTLGPPKLLFNDTKDQKTATINNGAWNLAEQSSFLKRGVACTSLNVINLTGQADLEDSINIILKEMARYSLADSRIAIIVSQPRLPPSPPPSLQEVNVFNQGYREECRKIFDETLSSLNQDPSKIPFMLVVLPKRDIPLYSEIKRWGDCEVGIPTVCITNDKLKKVGDATLRANIWYVVSFRIP